MFFFLALLGREITKKIEDKGLLNFLKSLFKMRYTVKKTTKAIKILRRLFNKKEKEKVNNRYTDVPKMIKKNTIAIFTGSPRKIAFVFRAFKLMCSSSIRVRSEGEIRVREGNRYHWN